LSKKGGRYKGLSTGIDRARKGEGLRQFAPKKEVGLIKKTPKKGGNNWEQGEKKGTGN